MVIDVSGAVGVINAALLALGVIGASLLGASWAVRAWRLLSGSGARDPIGGSLDGYYYYTEAERNSSTAEHDAWRRENGG